MADQKVPLQMGRLQADATTVVVFGGEIGARPVAMPQCRAAFDAGLCCPECGTLWIRGADLAAFVEQIEKADADLNDRSRSFLAQLRQYASEYDPVRLSDRQAKWLPDLAREAGFVLRARSAETLARRT